MLYQLSYTPPVREAGYTRGAERWQEAQPAMPFEPRCRLVHGGLA